MQVSSNIYGSFDEVSLSRSWILYACQCLFDSLMFFSRDEHDYIWKFSWNDLNIAEYKIQILIPISIIHICWTQCRAGNTINTKSYYNMIMIRQYCTHRNNNWDGNRDLQETHKKHRKVPTKEVESILHFVHHGCDCHIPWIQTRAAQAAQKLNLCLLQLYLAQYCGENKYIFIWRWYAMPGCNALFIFNLDRQRAAKLVSTKTDCRKGQHFTAQGRQRHRI